MPQCCFGWFKVLCDFWTEPMDLMNTFSDMYNSRRRKWDCFGGLSRHAKFIKHNLCQYHTIFQIFMQPHKVFFSNFYTIRCKHIKLFWHDDRTPILENAKCNKLNVIAIFNQLQLTLDFKNRKKYSTNIRTFLIHQQFKILL